MESANPILGNPLLLLAILLFLAILPRALRRISQKEKTALDRTVERFEKEELLTAAVGELNENNAQQEKPDSPKDGSLLAYIAEDLPASQETQGDGSIPPFPTQAEEKEKPVKIVKEGVPISHNELDDVLPAPEKKAKLIKQDISFAPGENKASSGKALSDPLKNKSLTQKQNLKEDSQGSPVSDLANEESDDNWVEAEIPGLIMDPPPPASKKPEIVPTFKASPKVKLPSETETSQKPPQKEKTSLKVKNIAPKSEEIKDSKPIKHVKTKRDSPELTMEISEPKPKIVEIKAPIASHKNIAKNEAGQEKAKAPSSKAERAWEIDPEVTAVPPQREDSKASPEKPKPKPFLLELKYLDQEELESVSQEDLPADMMDEVIARLHALQIDLENQLVSSPGQLAQSENPINGSMRKERVQDSPPDLEGAISEPSDKKEVSLEELDSFLFTTTQRKNKE